jgi:hypothetical protein
MTPKNSNGIKSSNKSKFSVNSIIRNYHDIVTIKKLKENKMKDNKFTTSNSHNKKGSHVKSKS